MDNQKRKTFINNILSRKNLKDNIVVSSIQGLCHCAQKNDDQILYPLLAENNKTIAGEALSALCNVFDQRNLLANRMIDLISPKQNTTQINDDELEFHAILELKALAENDKNILLLLLKIANERSCLNETMYLSNTVFLWESLAAIAGEKISGIESNELLYNPQSTEAEKIKSRIGHKIITRN